MSLIPGLGIGPPKEEASTDLQSRDITLSAGSEWRFEVAAESAITVKLLDSPEARRNDTGTAEIFGTELAPGHIYDFPGLTKAAIFSHHGCTLTVTGHCESEYVAEETPMDEYLNLHFALENMRAAAEANQADGPRVLVVGPEDAGKTSLVKMLTAYATRLRRTPLVINLDPHEGMLCLPGSVSAAVMGTGAVLDAEDAASHGWGSSPIGGPSATPVKMPLVYHYGYAGPEERPDIFKPVTTRLALATTGRFSDDAGVREAGMLVDIAGTVCSSKKGSEVVAHVVSEFSSMCRPYGRNSIVPLLWITANGSAVSAVNVILVIGSERLYSDMSRKFAKSADSSEDAIHVLKLSKSGGCVDRDSMYLQQLRQAQIRSYFFGTPKNTLSPHTTSLEFSSLAIFRAVDANSIHTDFLPGGAGEDDGDSKSMGHAILETVSPSMALQSALLAVKHANPTDLQEAIRDASVMGYLYISDVDESKQRLRILSPAGGRLPAKALVWGAWEIGAGMGDLLG